MKKETTLFEKCKYQLIISTIVIGTLIMGFGIGLTSERGLYHVIPFDNAGLEIIFVLILIIISGMIGGLLMGYLIAPLFLYIHKLVIGRRMVYAIQEKPEPDILKITFKPFFPALLSVHLALLFANNPKVINMILIDPSGELAPILTLTLLIVISSFVSMAIFSPIWFLLDSGIIYSNKEIVKTRREPIEVRSVGSWFMNQLRGYSTIALIVTYITFYIEMLLWFGPMDISTPLLLLLFPFILSVLCLPTIIALEFTIKHRNKYLHKFANKLGIIKKVGDPLKEL